MFPSSYWLAGCWPPGVVLILDIAYTFLSWIGCAEYEKVCRKEVGASREDAHRLLSKMRILVACEESQAVTIELRKLGHEAYSCDIEPCSGGHPEWHLQVDALELLKMKWDMIIAFPPCTYLTAAGAVRLFNHDGTVKDAERYEKGKYAAVFFSKFLQADCPRIAVENPTMLKCFGLPKYQQVIEPYMFGDPWKKRTCLWLKGLPPLLPTKWVEPEGLWVGSTSANRDPNIYTKYKLSINRDAKVRAKTFPGIAKAMAEQWAGKAEGSDYIDRK